MPYQSNAIIPVLVLVFLFCFVGSFVVYCLSSSCSNKATSTRMDDPINTSLSSTVHGDRAAPPLGPTDEEGKAT